MLDRAYRASAWLRDACVGRLRENIAFIHLPKCGGNSIHSAISARYPRSHRLKLSSGASKRAADRSGRELLAYRRDLLLYQLSLGGNGRLLSGHYPLDPEICKEFHSDWRFVTVLRHPVDRWISHYFYNLDADSPFGFSERLGDFVQTERAQDWGKLYVRHLGGCGSRYEQCDPGNAIESAKRSLEMCEAVGCLERPDRFIRMFQRRFGVNLKIGRQNVGHARQGKKGESIPGEVRRQIEALCWPDMQVYGHALRLADE